MFQLFFLVFFPLSFLFLIFFFFFFNDTATTEIYTLSLHDALPISKCVRCGPNPSEVSESDLFRGECLDRACELMVFLGCGMALPLCTEKVMKSARERSISADIALGRSDLNAIM